MSRSTIAAILHLCSIFILITCLPLSAQQEDRAIYTFGIHFESRGGMSSGQYFDIAKTITRVIKTDTGIEIDIKKYPSRIDSIQAFIANEIDGSILFTADVHRILKSGGAIEPWITYSFKGDKSNHNSICLWQNKDSAIQDPSMVSGGSLMLVDHDPFILIQLREYLNSAGIDQPIWKTFDNIKIVNGSNSAFIALTAGKADFYWDSHDFLNYLKLLAPTVKSSVSTNLCTEKKYARAIVAFNRKTVSEKNFPLAWDFADTLIHNMRAFVKKYPETRAAFEYARLADLELAHASLDDFKYDLDRYKLAEENGWLDEAEFLFEKLEAAPPGEPVEVKPDMNFCKKYCGDYDADCIISCLD